MTNTLDLQVYFSEQGLDIACFPEIAIRQKLDVTKLVTVLDEYSHESMVVHVLWSSPLTENQGISELYRRTLGLILSGLIFWILDGFIELIYTLMYPLKILSGIHTSLSNTPTDNQYHVHFFNPTGYDTCRTASYNCKK